MKAFKIYWKHHHKLQMARCWVIVIANSEEEAIAQAQREFIDKAIGYNHFISIKQLCKVKPDGATCIEWDNIPLKETTWPKE